MELASLLQSPAALPSIPRVIALLLAELDRDEPDLFQINQLLGQDPVLTTRLLQLVGTAHHQLRKPITSVGEAMALVGLQQVREMAYAAAATSAFRQVGNVDMPQFWRYSLNVAKLTRHLAQDASHQVSPFTAGLLHGLGMLVMHLGMPRQMEELDRRLPLYAPQRHSAEYELVGYNYAQVGADLARAWQLPQALVDILEHQDAPFERDSYEPLSGILHLAVWRCRAMEMGYTDQDLAKTFPDTTALALKMDLHEVLDRDPIAWTTRQEVSALTG